MLAETTLEVDSGHPTVYPLGKSGRRGLRGIAVNSCYPEKSLAGERHSGTEVKAAATTPWRLPAKHGN